MSLSQEKACHSERSDEGAKSKNLHIIDSAKQFLGAKILRLPSVAQDDRLFLNLKALANGEGP